MKKPRNPLDYEVSLRAGDGVSALQWSACREPTVARHPVDVGFATTEVKRRPGRRDRTLGAEVSPVQ